MIPVKEFREYLEKDASVKEWMNEAAKKLNDSEMAEKARKFGREFDDTVGKRLGQAGGKVLKAIGKVISKYPKTTIGVGLIAGGSITLLNKLQPVHQMYSEERKRGLYKKQNQLLNSILREERLSNIKPGPGPRYSRQPLS